MVPWQTPLAWTMVSKDRDMSQCHHGEIWTIGLPMKPLVWWIIFLLRGIFSYFLFQWGQQYPQYLPWPQAHWKTLPPSGSEKMYWQTWLASMSTCKGDLQALIAPLGMLSLLLPLSSPSISSLMEGGIKSLCDGNEGNETCYTDSMVTRDKTAFPFLWVVAQRWCWQHWWQSKWNKDGENGKGKKHTTGNRINKFQGKVAHSWGEWTTTSMKFLKLFEGNKKAKRNHPASEVERYTKAEEEINKGYFK